MKKAAILISGILRDYSNIENIKKYIINPNPEYEFDFFLVFCKSLANFKKAN